MARRIVVVGSSNTDMILKLPRIPRPGETILGGEFAIAAGGKGANQAVAASRAGGDVTMIARVGRDMFGERAIDALIEDGINVDFVAYDKSASGVALIFVGDDGENSIGVGSGANAKLAPSDVRKAKAAIANADAMILQLETPLDTIQAAVDLADANRTIVILNPAPAQALPDKLLKKVSILTPNETETELLTGVKMRDEASCRKAAGILLGKGIETVVITLGARGAFVATSRESRLVPGFSVKQVDTTAAGDTFNGALAVALAEGKSMIDAVRFANAAGAQCVTRLGAQPSVPTRLEIERLLKKHTANGKALVHGAHGLKSPTKSVRTARAKRSST